MCQYLVAVVATRRVQRLDQVGRVADEERVAGGAADHREHGDPQIGQRLRWEPAVAYTQHV